MKMDPCRLVREELAYELSVRGVADTNNLAVSTMRGMLSAFLRKEPLGKLITAENVNIEADNEITICQQKTGELESILTEFKGPEGGNEHKRIETKIQHLLGRLSRIQTDEEHLTVIKTELIEQLYDFERFLDKTLREIDQENMTSQPGSSRSTVPSTRINEPSTGQTKRKSVPVHQWGISFSGDGTGPSINAFLERIEEYRISRNVSIEDLFNSFSELLKGNALIWYRTVKTKVSTYPQLISRLRDEYQPFDYEVELWKEIRNRVQGSQESVGCYVSCMLNLFDRLPTRPSEEEKLRVLRRNIAPYFIYGIGLAEIDSVDEFLRVCKQLEHNKRMAENFNCSRTVNHNLLEPDLSPAVSIRERGRNSPAKVAATTSTFGKQCWNCLGRDHMYRNCTQPRSRKFCYGCGQPNTIKSKCSKCYKGNAQPGTL